MNYERMKTIATAYKVWYWPLPAGWDVVLFMRARVKPEHVIDAVWGDWRDNDKYLGKPDICKESTYSENVRHQFKFDSWRTRSWPSGHLTTNSVGR